MVDLTIGSLQQMDALTDDEARELGRRVLRGM